MMKFDLLRDQLITIADRATRRRRRVSLPELYEALVRNEVTDFCALRPHQRHVWHAFLVQIGAIAMHRDGVTALPDEADTWRRMLMALTPGEANAGAWALAAPPDQPALLQPPVPGGVLAGFKQVDTPDGLDLLVTSSNHELKRDVMWRARPEHWLYALVSLQSQEGYSGKTRYGIARMNGGYSNRPGFGIVLHGGPGRRMVRDLTRLLKIRDKLLEWHQHYPSENGTALLWLVPWDGNKSLRLQELDVFFVEVCRRVRLEATSVNTLRARAAGSKVPRVDAKSLDGVTGDAWTPVVRKAGARAALTATADTVSYRRLVPILFPRLADPNAVERAPLQVIAADDDAKGLVVLAQVVVRGEGKTESFRERRIPVSNARRWFTADVPSDRGADIANERLQDAAAFGKAFYRAAMTVYTAAPSEVERGRDDRTAKDRASRATAAMERRIDDSFFPALDEELAMADDPVACQRVRARWLVALRRIGRSELGSVVRSAPDAAMRHYRTRVSAFDVFGAAFKRAFGERPFLADAERESIGAAPGVEPDSSRELEE